MSTPPILDGHNDFLSRAYEKASDPAAMLRASDDGHIDLERARAGRFAGGFFAVWLPSPVDLEGLTAQMSQPSYDLPMPEPLDASYAARVAMAQVAILHRLAADGLLRICTRVRDIEAAIAEGVLAAILHFEGAEAIDPDFHALEVFHAAGLRSLGPVWSRHTRFASGVPFRYPATPDIGSGLTDDGKALVRACNRLGIMLDVSHLNEAGFWDLAKISDAPLVATHSNAHALCPHARNLTDAQLEAIAASDGMVGLNFAAAFLREDGQMLADVPMETVLRHLDHLIERLGEDRVGLGSDFDGAVVPEAIGDIAGLPVLVRAMEEHQYGDALIRKICMGNWLRVLGKTWKD